MSRTHSPRDVTPEDCAASRAGRPKGSEEGFRRPPHPFRPCSSARSVGNVPRASHLIHSAIDVENIDRQRAHRNVARQPDRPPRPETRSGPSPPPEPRPQYMSGGIEYISSGGGPPRGADLGRFVVPRWTPRCSTPPWPASTSAAESSRRVDGAPRPGGQYVINLHPSDTPAIAASDTQSNQRGISLTSRGHQPIRSRGVVLPSVGQE